jgi:CRISPR-associated protein Csb2
LGAVGVWRLISTDTQESRQALRYETWTRASRLWSSVTPFVFGRYPRALWGDEAAELVREACVISGLPRPVDVATARDGWILGAPSADRFPPLPSRPGKPRRLQAHIRIQFAEAVAGPVLIGAGRHQGYGLCRQLNEGM